jgi:excisionase family DNA binding protein
MTNSTSPMTGFLDCAELAERLGISTRTLCRWFRLAKGPPRIKIGRRVLYREEAVHNWMLAQENEHLK